MTGRFAGLAARTLTAFLATTALVASILAVAPPSSASAVAGSTSSLVATVEPLQGQPMIKTAADLSQFRAGNIISNEVFFDSQTMNEAQIDTFLKGKVARCQSGYTCLKDFRQDTSTRNADSYCSTYQGGSSESAARIIYKVAIACGINPQVLIVMLEKEQGLVTHTWPSDWRYTSAMGQGCPDTAACDSRYYGFFNQMYGAARQLKIYSANTYFTYYAPGKTWNIRYHPNTSCGSSAVYVENQATANLYYYTPYQPNAAALRAGYGEGDGCSAYGNRNFYNYFSDWFGSLQQPASRLIRAAGDPAVYLVNGGSKYHVSTYDDLLAFQSRLGGVVTVASSYIGAIASGGDITRYVHDPRSGTLYLLDTDGSRHRLVSAAQIAQFGYDFGSYVNLEPAIVDAFPAGAEVNDFRRVANGNEVFLLADGAFRYVQSMDIWRALQSGAATYAANMNQGATTGIRRGPDAFPMNALVRERDTAEVYLVGGGNSLIYVPSLDLAKDFGATGSYVVNPGSLGGWNKVPQGLGAAVSCDTQTYVPSAGAAVAVSGLSATGVTASALPASACSAFRIATAAQSSPLFVSIAGSGAVYQITGGKLQHVLSYDDLMRRNGDRPLALLSWSKGTADRLGYSAPALADRSFVQFSGSGEVYYVDTGVLRHVRDYSTMISLAGGQVPPVSTIDGAFRATYTFGPAL